MAVVVATDGRALGVKIPKQGVLPITRAMTLQYRGIFFFNFFFC